MGRLISNNSFEWDSAKEAYNVKEHGVDFSVASEVFFDANRLIAIDESHSQNEERFFCIGKVKGKIITVRFTTRNRKIRIIGAGKWRKGKKIYEEKIKK